MNPVVHSSRIRQSSYTCHLFDTDKDGKADKRQVVFAGFGTEDTHHILHTFRWGPDAAIYFNQSIYIHTHMETPEGVKRLMGSGIWRYDWRRGTADVVMRGLVNPWGHVFDRYGQKLRNGRCGWRWHQLRVPRFGIPNRGWVPASHAGAESRPAKTLRARSDQRIALAGRLGQNTLVTNDFRGNRINRFELTDEGSGYVSKQMPDVLTSKHRAFRPVDLKLGPDGALYVARLVQPNHQPRRSRFPRFEARLQTRSNLANCRARPTAHSRTRLHRIVHDRPRRHARPAGTANATDGSGRTAQT